MKRGLIFGVAFLLTLTLISFASAIPSLEISKNAINKVIVRELSIPAIYDLTITNNGEGDIFRIDTLLDVLMYPKDTFTLGTGETKIITEKIYPRASEKNRYYGDWSFRYYVQGDSTGVFNDNIIVRILSLKDIISVDVPTSIKASDDSFIMTVKNSENLSFDMSMNVDSSILQY
jgi:hypothetical protein